MTPNGLNTLAYPEEEVFAPRYDPRLGSKRGENEPSNSEHHGNNKCVAPMLMRIKDDETSLVRGHACYKQNCEYCERSEHRPTFSTPDWNERQHYANDPERAHERCWPWPGVFRQRLHTWMLMRMRGEGWS
jgi:hypothetical protein